MLRPRAGGFTLVELMVTVAVLGLLLVLGAPALRGVVENGRIRAAAESWQYGLTLARSEAVRRNTLVQFVTTDAGWVVSTMDGTVLHEGSGKERTAQLDVTLTPDTATRVTYGPFGRALDPNPDNSEAITQVDIESANPPNLDSYRPLRIQLLAGGVSRVCDPELDPDSDPRACL